MGYMFQALEQQAGVSDDFQEVSVQDREASKRKFSMDAVLEDKICDLYDLFVDVLFFACNDSSRVFGSFSSQENIFFLYLIFYLCFLMVVGAG